MHVYIARVLADPGKQWWVWDEKALMKSAAGESQRAVLARWEAAHGKPDEATRYRGTMRPSEAAMTVGSTRRLPPVRPG